MQLLRVSGLALLMAAFGLQAAFVGVGGYTNDFSLKPGAVDFATATIGGGSGDLSTAAGLDAAVALLRAASINTPLLVATGSPPGGSATAVFNDTDKNVQTRPNAAKMTVLMATFTNNAVRDASSVRIHFDLLQSAIAAEQVNGVRVYYSVTGQTNSWVNIPALNATNAGEFSAEVALDTPWTNGLPLYVLFADDNGSPSLETANQIDNFFIGIAAFVAELPVVITTQPQSLTVAEREPATFTAAARSYTPVTFQWYRGASPIADATNASYTLAFPRMPDNGALFSVVAANVASNVSYTATSSIATLTVLADTNPPTLVKVIPDTKTPMVALDRIEVHFSEAVTNLDATDFLINRLPATNVLLFTPGVYVFYFTQPPTGTVEIAWAAGHGITDLASSPLSFVDSPWTYTLNPDIEELWITEFVASNDNGIRDEDGDRRDWIEIYNSGTKAVNLDGWHLTIDPANPNMWRFPGVTLASHAYMYLFASGKDRRNITSRLHTNFKLAKSGGSIVLTRPYGGITSQFLAYPPQVDDVSYGRDASNPDAIGYYTVPTPGARNQSIGSGFAPAVQFSRSGGSFVTSFHLVLSTTSSNAVIRYTTNNTVPTATSPAYVAPIVVSATTMFRARAFQTGLLPGEIRSEAFVQLDSAASIMKFTSDLPIVILHNLGGGGVPASADQPVVIQVFEPKYGRSSMTNTPDLTEHGIFHLRGSSTLGYSKGSFMVEVQDEFGRDKDVSFISDLPEDSDWVLYAPNNFDGVLVRNPVAYDLSWQIGRYASRTRFVEVYLKDDSGVPGKVVAADYNGIYVLEEKIKISKDRVDIDKLQPQNTNAPSVTGGYLLSIDRVPAGESSFPGAGNNVNYIDPKYAEITLAERDAQEQYINNYFASFGNALNGPSYTNSVTGYAAYVDVDSWIDHAVLNVITFNVDAFRLSTYLYKPRNGKITFGPVWDFDRTQGSTDGRDINPRVWSSSGSTDFFNYPWWGRMFTDRDFWQKWIDRYQELRHEQKTFSTTNIAATIEKFASQVRAAQPRELARWGVGMRSGGGGLDGTYNGEVQFMKNWYSNRLDFIDRELQSRPTLSSPGGVITSGFQLAAVAPAGATIYYTLDGTDPRAPGGAIGTNARAYSGVITLTNNARIVARARNPNHQNLTGGMNPPISSPWSGPVAATFIEHTPPLVITELMYHPSATPPAGNTNDADIYEYIELKNAGDTPLNLFHFKLSGGIDFIFPNLTLAAGQRVIVAANTNAFIARYGAGILLAGQFTRQLDNAGDHIVLQDPLLEPILDFSYQDSWHPTTDGLGFSLVVVNENAEPDAWSSKSNWRPSTAQHGSPGSNDLAAPVFPIVLVNEVLANGAPPQADAIELYNSSTNLADISGWFLSDSLDQPQKFVIPPGTIIPGGGFLVFYETNSFGAANASTAYGANAFGLGASGDDAYLFSGNYTGLTGYAHGFSFGASPTNITYGRFEISTGPDLFVLQLSNTLGGPNSGPFIGPIAGPIVINEFMHDPASPNISFIELYNTSSNLAFDLSYWQLNGLSYTFPPGSSIGPRAFLVLAANRTAFAAMYGADIPVFDTFSGVFQADGETLTLIQPGPTPAQNVMVDRVRYETAAPWSSRVGTGFAFQLIDPLQDNSRVGNWYSSYVPGSHTPGYIIPGSIIPGTNIPSMFIPGTTNDNMRFVSITGAVGNPPTLLLYLGDVGDVYIDDLFLANGTIPETGTNYIVNGSFETPLDGAPAVTNFFTVGAYHADTVISPTNAHTGSNSLHLISTNTSSFALNKILQKVLPVTNGQICTLSFWYRPTFSVTNLYARIQNSTIGSASVPSAILTPPFTLNSNTLPITILPVTNPPTIIPAVTTLPQFVRTPGTTNTTAADLPAFPPLWLNEVQPLNLAGLTDSTGQHEPWIELFNAGANAVSLAGLYLADNFTNLTQWAFPTGAMINPGEFKVLFADGETNQSTPSELHTSFRLMATNGTIALSRLRDGQAEVLDYIHYAGVPANSACGSVPDAQPFDRVLLFPGTPGVSNAGASTPPVLTPVPDLTTGPTKRIVFTNAVTNPDNLPLTFSLGPGAPAGARVNPTNGVFVWRPTFAQAPSTNWVTVWVSASSVPPWSASNTFRIVVGDYVQMRLGSDVVPGGSSASLPMHSYSSAALTNLAFTVRPAVPYLTNVAVQPAAPLSTTMTERADGGWDLVFAPPAGQWLQGAQELGQLDFLVRSNLPSAMVYLEVSPIQAEGAGMMITNLFGYNGRVVAVENEPLLEPVAGTEPLQSQPSQLILYGKPGSNYVIEAAMAMSSTMNWEPWLTNQLDGLYRVFEDVPLTNQPLFFRAFLK